METPKEIFLQYIRGLPEEVSWDDIEYFFYVRRSIEQGKKSIERGEYFTQEEVEKGLKEEFRRGLEKTYPRKSA